MRFLSTKRFIQSALACGLLSGTGFALGGELPAGPGAVILQNRPLPGGASVLPLDGAKVKKVVVAGPEAELVLVSGSHSTPGSLRSLLEVLQERGRKEGFQVVLEPWIASGFTPVAAGVLTPDEKTPEVCGLKGEYFANLNLEGKPIGSRTDAGLALSVDVAKPDSLVKLDGFSVRWTGFIKPPLAGKFRIRLGGEGKSRVWIKDHLVYDGWDKDPKKGGMGEFTNVPEFKEGELSPVRVEYRNFGALRIALSWMTFAKNDFSPLKNADVVILAVGSEPDEFLTAAGVVNPATVAVFRSSTPGRDGPPPRPSSAPAQALPPLGDWAREHLPAILQLREGTGGEAVEALLFLNPPKKMLP